MLGVDTAAPQLGGGPRFSGPAFVPSLRARALDDDASLETAGADEVTQDRGRRRRPADVAEADDADAKGPGVGRTGAGGRESVHRARVPAPDSRPGPRGRPMRGGGAILDRMRPAEPAGAAAAAGATHPGPALRAVTVFCGARAGADRRHAEAARALGAELATRGITLVYGGGAVGLMGITADAVLAGGGRVVGVIPEALAGPEVLHPRLTETHVVASMHERKALMAARADAFIALPGGLGTLDELVEILTWRQLGIHHRPCGLLEVGGFWRPFTVLLDALVEEGFMPAAAVTPCCARRIRPRSSTRSPP